jgi:hypothetical protein
MRRGDDDVARGRRGGLNIHKIRPPALFARQRDNALTDRVRNRQVLERVAATSAVSVATFFAEAQRIESEATRDGGEARDGVIAGS